MEEAMAINEEITAAEGSPAHKGEAQGGDDKEEQEGCGDQPMTTDKYLINGQDFGYTDEVDQKKETTNEPQLKKRQKNKNQ